MHLWQASVTHVCIPRGATCVGGTPKSSHGKRTWRHVGTRCELLWEGSCSPSSFLQVRGKLHNRAIRTHFVLVRRREWRCRRLLGAPFKAQLVRSHGASEAGLFQGLSASCSWLPALSPPDTQKGHRDQTAQQRPWEQHPAPTLFLYGSQSHEGGGHLTLGHYPVLQPPHLSEVM